jgi:hypothetical protein
MWGLNVHNVETPKAENTLKTKGQKTAFSPPKAENILKRKLVKRTARKTTKCPRG